MAIFTAKRLSGPAFLTTSAVAVYTAPAGKTGVVKQIILNNTSAAAATVTAHVVPNAGTASASNQIITSLSISANSQIIWAADIPLAAGDSIQLLSNAGSAITGTVTGIEIE